MSLYRVTIYRRVTEIIEQASKNRGEKIGDSRDALTEILKKYHALKTAQESNTHGRNGTGGSSSDKAQGYLEGELKKYINFNITVHAPPGADGNMYASLIRDQVHSAYSNFASGAVDPKNLFNAPISVST